jgi:hypothetical protein
MPGDSPTVKAPSKSKDGPVVVVYDLELAKFDESIAMCNALSMDKALELAQSNKSIADWELRKAKFIRQVKESLINPSGGVAEAFPEVRI